MTTLSLLCFQTLNAEISNMKIIIRFFFSGMFVYHNKSRCYWFSTSQAGNLREYNLIGVVSFKMMLKIKLVFRDYWSFVSISWIDFEICYKPLIEM